MYEFIDRPVTELDRGSRFLVWSMRSWLLACGQEHCPAATIGPAFARWRMIGGLQPFHRTMLILNRNALEKLGFCSLGCNRVSEHEAILIALVAMIGSGELVAARNTLAMLVDEDWVGDCLGSLSALAGAMEGNGVLPAAPRPGPASPGTGDCGRSGRKM